MGSVWRPLDAVTTSNRARSWIPLRPLAALLRGRVGFIIALVLSAILSGLAETAILGSLAEGGAALVNGASRAHFSFGPLHVDERLGVLFLFALGCALLRLVLQVVISVVPASIAADVLAGLRRELFASFTRASWSEQSRDREGYLQELLTAQSMQAAIGALQVAVLVVAVTSLLVLVASAFALNVLAALIVLVAAGLLFLIMRPLSELGSRRARAVSEASLVYAGSVNEAVRVAEETHVFGSQSAQRARVEGFINRMRGPYFHVQFLGTLVAVLYQSAIYVIVVLALLILYLTTAGHVAALGAVVLLLVRAGSYGQQVQGGYQVCRQAIPFLERIEQARQGYLASTPQIVGRPLEVVNEIALERVSYAYSPERPVLADVSFRVHPGETVGIIGPTGAGKSTLVQILLGLREPASGAYLVNGLPARDFARDDWHRAFAYLPQQPRLLHESVRDNIRFFRDHLDDDAVETAARMAGIEQEILMWPDGYETIVGPRADAISGGQQQRICLARALAARPQVLVLDEPTSALDPHTEQAIQVSLAAIKQELMLFIVAHRMSTLDICDRVMVIVGGRVQAFDTTDALMKESAYYRRASGLLTGAPTIDPA